MGADSHEGEYVAGRGHFGLRLQSVPICNKSVPIGAAPVLATTFSHSPQVPPSAWSKQGHRALQLGVQAIAAEEDCPNLTPIPQPQGCRPSAR
ncbi:unnamed protein product [Urochloa humidicola]